MFGLGWLRDAVRIPDYARQANAHPEHEARHAAKVAASPRPPHHTSRLRAWIMIGAWYYFSVGFLASFAVPSSCAYALGGLAMGCGVWGVSSALGCRAQCLPFGRVLGAFLTLFFLSRLKLYIIGYRF